MSFAPRFAAGISIACQGDLSRGMADFLNAFKQRAAFLLKNRFVEFVNDTMQPLQFAEFFLEIFYSLCCAKRQLMGWVEHLAADSVDLFK